MEERISPRRRYNLEHDLRDLMDDPIRNDCVQLVGAEEMVKRAKENILHAIGINPLYAPLVQIDWNRIRYLGTT